MEILRVVENYIMQLKISGYSRRDSREIIVCGLVGWKRKRMKRLEEKPGKPYRKGKETLKLRTKRKLLANTTWFKTKKTEEDNLRRKGVQGKGGKMGGGKKIGKLVRGESKGKEIEKIKGNGRKGAKAVVFVPFTEGSELAGDLRGVEIKMDELTDIKMKVVERAGTKLADMLTRSDPWSGTDCGRLNCPLDETKMKTGKFKTQNCTTRSIVYMTWCQTCYDNDVEKLEGSKEEIEDKKKRIKYHLYIGESSRSAFERGSEHLAGIKRLMSSNHFLKHLVDKHKNEDWDKIEMRMKIMTTHRKAFERQIHEAVLIQEYRHHFLLNSKAEYNRSALPRLGLKMGDKEFRKLEEANKEELEKESMLEKEIINIKKERSLKRRNPIENQPENKRARLENEHPVNITPPSPPAQDHKESPPEQENVEQHCNRANKIQDHKESEEKGGEKGKITSYFKKSLDCNHKNISVEHENVKQLCNRANLTSVSENEEGIKHPEGDQEIAKLSPSTGRPSSGRLILQDPGQVEQGASCQFLPALPVNNFTSLTGKSTLQESKQENETIDVPAISTMEKVENIEEAWENKDKIVLMNNVQGVQRFVCQDCSEEKVHECLVDNISIPLPTSVAMTVDTCLPEVQPLPVELCYDMLTINRERREKREKEEKVKRCKIEKAKELSKRWELLRICVEFLKEHEGVWERRKQEKKNDKTEEEKVIEKKIRFEKIERKKEAVRKRQYSKKSLAN